jgi:hypothetical protein
VEYQGLDTLGKFALELADNTLLLLPMYTNCLASDLCGIPDPKDVQVVGEVARACTPGQGCC